MTLSGRLESIPLPEVLRLLARSRKTGCLRVEAAQTEGKIYLDEGGLVYSTTRREDDLRSDLLNAGFVTADDWIKVERRERDLTDVLRPGKTTAELRDFIAEQGTEVIFRLQRPGRGQFDFHEDERPRYEAGERVDIEKALAEAEHRVAQWAEIEEVIPSTRHRLRMASALPEGARDVTVTSSTWRLLAAIGGQATVEEIAERLGSTEFTVAQALSSMVRSGLVELAEQLAAPRYTYEAEDLATVAFANGQNEDGAHSAVDADETATDELQDGEIIGEVDDNGHAQGEDPAELLGDLLSTGDDGVEDDDVEDDGLEILDAEYDPDSDVEGSLSDRVKARREADELRALANELTDLTE